MPRSATCCSDEHFVWASGDEQADANKVRRPVETGVASRLEGRKYENEKVDHRRAS
jgi:hypothetical protein